MRDGRGHHPGTRVQPHPARVVGVQLAAAQRDRPLAVALRVHPTHDAGEAAAVEVFVLCDQPTRNPRGEPQTAADGCAASASTSVESAGLEMPQMSVARCITLGRVNT